MKTLAAAMLAALPLLVAAQPVPPPPPLNDRPAAPPRAATTHAPLPEIRDVDPQITKGAQEPQTTERMEGDTRIQEYRLNGKLYMQRVTPAHGKTYVLMDNKGDGTFTRLEQTLDQQVRVPQWVLWEF
jgi:hypothetical protein